MDALTLIWSLSLALGLVVIGVVAFLLHLINKTAAEIDVVAADIWTQGKMTANNTIHIPLFLASTNQVVTKIYQTAVPIIEGASLIRQHAEGCPGCPNCVLEHHKEQ